jgi:hypothetical protein
MRRQLFQYPSGRETRRRCAIEQAECQDQTSLTNPAAGHVAEVPANVDAER